MNDREKAVLYNQLVSMRSAIDSALFLLEGDSICHHKNKQDFTTMGGKEHWICRDCGFEYKESEN